MVRPLVGLVVSSRYSLGIGAGSAHRSSSLLLPVSSRYSLGIGAGSAHRSLSAFVARGVVFDGMVTIIGEGVIIVAVGGVEVVVGVLYMYICVHILLCVCMYVCMYVLCMYYVCVSVL